MKRNPISPDDLRLLALTTWSKRWPLLTSGDYASGDFNTMTVGWGGLGVMWNKPVAIVVVRPSRYTYEFMERHDTFTLSVLPESWREALKICGTKSGRDIDKILHTGLTPIPSSAIAAPGFDEAELVIECRKISTTPFQSEQFLHPDIMLHYPEGDLHLMTLGEIIAVHGTVDYQGATTPQAGT